MAFGLNFRLRDSLPALEDEIRVTFDDVRQDLSAASDDLLDALARSDAAGVFDGSAFREVLERNDLAGIDGVPDIRNLNDLAEIADELPAGFGDPDSTGEVPTGSAAIGREQAAVGASLAAAPRIVEAFGGTAAFVDVRGQSFAVTETYRDDASGFSGLRLTAVAGGAEVFAVDGLQVGSQADAVAAATLGRLQVESEAFRAFVADAAETVTVAGRPVFFTGPSLGGAVAQVAAYETAEALVAAGGAFGVTAGGAFGVAAGGAFGAAAVQLVTVDPLGGRDAAEAINGGTLDPNALALITALNLRTEGDVVSRIGSHLGATLTLPALDEAGNPVVLNAADAHVNVVSLLQTLSSDVLFAAGTIGAPAEIGGFAAASNAAADGLIDAWLATGAVEEPGVGGLQIPGTASFDSTGTVWSLDADENGTTDLSVRLSAPVSQATADLLLG